MSECQVHQDIKWCSIEGYRSRWSQGSVSHGWAIESRCGSRKSENFIYRYG